MICHLPYELMTTACYQQWVVGLIDNTIEASLHYKSVTRLKVTMSDNVV